MIVTFYTYMYNIKSIMNSVFYLFFKISSLTSNLLTMSSNGTDEKCSTSPLKYATCRVIIRVESNPEVIVLLPAFQISTDTLKFLLATTVEGGLCENASNFAGAKKELKHYNVSEEFMHLYFYKCETRGPRATSLTWETSSNQLTHLNKIMIIS